MSQDVSKTEAAKTEAAKTEAAAQVVAPAQPRVQGRRLLRGELGQVPVVLTLIVVAVFFQISSGGLFLRPRNLSNLVLETVTVGTLALASVLVLLLGEIDLSLAVVAYFCGAVLTTLSVYGKQPAIVAVLAALVAGAMVGAVNGFFVAVMRVPSFIVTLAGLLFYQGLLLHILFPNTTIRLIDPFLTGISSNYLPDWMGTSVPLVIVAIYVAAVIFNRIRRQQRGLPNPPIWETALRMGVAIAVTIIAVGIFEGFLGVPESGAILVALILIFWLLLRFTPFGRHVYAVGGNAEAARRAGINTTGVRIAIFTLTSTLAAVAGILEVSRTIGAATQVEPQLLLLAIAAAVIGGVSLFGGRGSVWGVVLGALIIGSLNNGLTLINQNDDVKFMVEGAVLMVAVLVDAIIRRRNAVTGR